MGKSLYRSYRSTSFDEIIGQEHVTTTLKNALAKKSVSHAYLLSGPRGTGKTSVARILAYAVNDQPYSLEGQNLDIIEIDAASNRRIDEIREIRDRVHIAPTAGKYKIYIIDEVHMLTREAFNALLKTLEEPPEHVIFILATTETHKVPETILSRCIRLNFRPISQNDIAAHLTTIAKNEKITISSDAVYLLAEHARGSFRDGISLLEQVKYLAPKVERSHVSSMLGLASDEVVDGIIANLESRDTQGLARILEQATASGVNIAMLCSQLQAQLRALLVSGSSSSLDSGEILKLQKDLLLVPGSAKPQIELEICLYDVTLSGVSSNSEDNPEPKKKVTLPNRDEAKQAAELPKPKKLAETTVRPPEIATAIKQEVQSPSSNLWEDFLKALKAKNNTLYSIARMAKFNQKDDAINLAFTFTFHQKQVNDPKNKALFSQLLSELHGAPVTLTTSILDKEAMPETTEDDDVLKNVSNIFGAHEVLES